MKKEHKPLSTKKPPIPTEDHGIIEDWITNKTMLWIETMVKQIDTLLNKIVPNLQYAIKWGNAYYGTKDNWWFIELAAYSVSVNIVFLNGAKLNSLLLLWDANESRYIKLNKIEEVNNKEIIDLVKKSSSVSWWKYEN